MTSSILSNKISVPITESTIRFFSSSSSESVQLSTSIQQSSLSDGASYTVTVLITKIEMSGKCGDRRRRRNRNRNRLGSKDLIVFRRRPGGSTKTIQTIRSLRASTLSSVQHADSCLDVTLSFPLFVVCSFYARTLSPFQNCSPDLSRRFRFFIIPNYSSLRVLIFSLIFSFVPRHCSPL